MSIRPILPLLVLATAAACADPLSHSERPVPSGAPSEVWAMVQCKVELTSSSMTCGPEGVGSGQGASHDLIVGGQGTYVRLASGAITVKADSFHVPVSVQNLTPQMMGTVDEFHVSPRGIRVFFHSGPTNGVEVANPDGTATYTAADQPYFQYNGTLQPQQVSALKRWSFRLNGATSFTFSVYVVAEVPSETGVLRFERVAGAVSSMNLSGVWTDGTSIVAVGGTNRILVSQDRGQTWAMTRSGTLALHGVGGDGKNVFVAGERGQVFRSTDRGLTWRNAGNAEVTHRAVWSEDSLVFVVGTATRRSTNGGVSWTTLHLNSSRNAIWGEGSLVISVGLGGVHRSDDAGATWTGPATGTNISLRSIWGHGSTVLAVGTGDREGGAIRSVDGGLTWSRIPGLSAERNYNGVWGSGSTFFVASSRRVYRSTDGGVTWTEVLDGGPSFDRGRYLGSISGEGNTVVAVGGRAIFVSTDGGTTWTDVDPPRPALFGIWRDGNVAVAVGGEIRRSTDGGRTWATVDSGTTPPMAAISGDGATLVAVGRGMVRRSTDAGVSWDGGTNVVTGFLTGVWLRGSEAVAVGENGLIIRSTDAGLSWTPISSGTDINLHGVWGDGTTILAVGEAGLILRSVDSGLTWSSRTLLTSGFYGIWGEAGNFVVAGWYARIARTPDGGVTWGGGGHPNRLTYPLWSVAGRGSTYIATSHYGHVYRSSEYGQNFHYLYTGSDFPLRGAHVQDANDILIVGDGGVILRGRR